MCLLHGGASSCTQNLGVQIYPNVGGNCHYYCYYICTATPPSPAPEHTMHSIAISQTGTVQSEQLWTLWAQYLWACYFHILRSFDNL